ncbi:jg22309 [Pararge aegeria aegeria]|uniref:Jg22309 protein n=1 Tax=Pararge aegeria aegeria TaxID=348720 RepID=A0A8S4QZ68_9NEOP|nr:jg22309 [Pararge aegeria aegeria]
MSCRGSCQCSTGYYERQRGDCRKIGLEVGDSCVLDIDCQFPNGVCDLARLRCIYNGTTPEPEAEPVEEPGTQMVPLNAAVPRITCNATTPCEQPFECSSSGVCICTVGYYESPNGQRCLAGNFEYSVHYSTSQALLFDTHINLAVLLAKSFDQHLKKLSLGCWIKGRIQKAVDLETERIVRRFLTLEL